jgi:4-hydroxy-3-polyprenylbenzoate decarboxylase
MNKKIIVGISGASGAIYAVKLIESLFILKIQIHIVISEIGAKVFAHELNIRQEDIPGFFARIHEKDETEGKYIIHDSTDMFAPIASGSFPATAMVIIPCSMKTLAGVTAGYTSNLLERAADVTLKERRPLILVTRETPLSRVHLKNMIAAHDAGATIMPASPGFYHHPQSIDDLAAFITGRVLDHLKIDNSCSPAWGETDPPPSFSSSRE